LQRLRADRGDDKGGRNATPDSFVLDVLREQASRKAEGQHDP